MGNAIEADEEQLKSLHRKLHTHKLFLLNIDQYQLNNFSISK